MPTSEDRRSTASMGIDGQPVADDLESGSPATLGSPMGHPARVRRAGSGPRTPDARRREWKYLARTRAASVAARSVGRLTSVISGASAICESDSGRRPTPPGSSRPGRPWGRCRMPDIDDGVIGPRRPAASMARTASATCSQPRALPRWTSMGRPRARSEAKRIMAERCSPMSSRSSYIMHGRSVTARSPGPDLVLHQLLAQPLGQAVAVVRLGQRRPRPSDRSWARRLRRWRSRRSMLSLRLQSCRTLLMPATLVAMPVSRPARRSCGRPALPAGRPRPVPSRRPAAGRVDD